MSASVNVVLFLFFGYLGFGIGHYFTNLDRTSMKMRTKSRRKNIIVAVIGRLYALIIWIKKTQKDMIPISDSLYTLASRNLNINIALMIDLFMGMENDLGFSTLRTNYDGLLETMIVGYVDLLAFAVFVDIVGFLDPARHGQVVNGIDFNLGHLSNSFLILSRALLFIMDSFVAIVRQSIPDSFLIPLSWYSSTVTSESNC
jgi:hypothetical protein